MLCEVCKKAQATTVIQRTDENGEDEELYVCDACANEKSEEGNDGESDANDSKMDIFDALVESSEIPPLPDDISQDDLANLKHRIESDENGPPDFVKDLLSATIGFMEGVSKAEKRNAKTKKCPGCGKTFKEIVDHNAVGCPECWTYFGDKIAAALERHQYGSRHVGSVPQQTANGKPSRVFLEKELAKAVKAQHYRKAAKLRKQLDEMDDSQK